jgi:D-glycero-alpha-D-manno-heptose-7-phosphate kinase
MSTRLPITHQSKAPLRISFAGGGTDVRPYCDLFGGAVVNAAIDLYAHATLIPQESSARHLTMQNKGMGNEADPDIALPQAVVDYVEKKFGPYAGGFQLMGNLDVEKCSGLGSSSALVVAFLAVLLDWKKIAYSPMELAAMAVDVERNWMHWPGGQQDQYAAALGGINLMEFHEHGKVTVTPIRITETQRTAWEKQLLLFYSGVVRPPQRIIETQQSHVVAKTEVPLQAMHAIRAQAYQFRDLLEGSDWDQLGAALHAGFLQKKKMAAGISNEALDQLYQQVLQAGARGGKISGAGGGGFMFFDCQPEKQTAVLAVLQSFGGQVYPLHFTAQGVQSWRTI